MLPMSNDLLPEPTIAKSPKTRPKVASAFSQAKRLQELLFEAAKKPSIRPAELSGVSRAFVELEECKRKLRMRPLPKAVDVTLKGRSKPKHSGIAET